MGFIIEDFRSAALDNWYWFEEAFKPEEFDALEKLQATIPFKKAAISSETDESYRKSEIKWLEQGNPQCRWLYEKFVTLVTEANSALWHFELTGIFDDLQYTVYHEGGGHYDWHMDTGSGVFSKRKVSITLQLSGPDEYEGGDFEFLLGKDLTRLPRKKGCAIIFPSFFLHRVAPVTRGIRKSLVLWISGQPYR